MPRGTEEKELKSRGAEVAKGWEAYGKREKNEGLGSCEAMRGKGAVG